MNDPQRPALGPETWFDRLIILNARWVIVASVLLVALAGGFGSGVISKLDGGGFDDPASDSSRAARELAGTFGYQVPNLTLLVRAPSGDTVDTPSVVAAATAVLTRLKAEPGVTVQGAYWTAAGAVKSSLRGTDGNQALVLAHLDGDENHIDDRIAALGPRYDRTLTGVRFVLGGAAQVNADINNQVGADLTRAEEIAVPLTLLLLMLVFGSVVAALLPLLVGGIAIAGAFAALTVIAALTDVSVFALNLTTAMGLGLGIDYALLIVSRFREEVEHGHPTPHAVSITVRTAGRTVMFSAATIALALSALFVFPMYFLRSFAYAGIAVVLIAAAGALVTLPAMLAVLGPRIDGWRVVPRRPATALGGGFWFRLARLVMRRPVLTGAPVALLLLALGVPFLHVDFGLPDDQVIPAAQSQARVVGDAVRDHFTALDDQALTVVLTNVGAADPAVVSDYALRLSRIPDVSRVDAPAGTAVEGTLRAAADPSRSSGSARYLTVVLDVDSAGATAQNLVREVRARPAPGPRLVGGPAAELVDAKASTRARLVPAIAIVAVTTFLLLFLFTGSVVLPFKALVINAVSIAGVFGAMVWVFQDGHGAALLGFTPMPLSLTMPLLMFCVAFGLSMDYEVFLLGRIKEQHDTGADTATAVAVGLERTGRIVTAAAALLAVTFLAFVTSRVNFIQMFGLGLALAVVMDATLVRGVLVPALMRVMGEANWWAPRPLRQLHARIGLSEGPPKPDVHHRPVHTERDRL